MNHPDLEFVVYQKTGKHEAVRVVLVLDGLATDPNVRAKGYRVERAHAEAPRALGGAGPLVSEWQPHPSPAPVLTQALNAFRRVILAAREARS